MSDTPKTDAALIEKILCTEGGDEECTVHPAVEMVEADFARELEREATKKTALLREFTEYLEGETPPANCACHICAPCSDCTNWAAARELVASARALLSK